MAKKSAKKSFEGYLEQLEEIADELEAGDLPLEEALKKYEEAVKAFRLCQQMLKKAEQRIEVLLRDAEGNLTPQPFEPGAEPPAKADSQPEEAGTDTNAETEDEETPGGHELF